MASCLSERRRRYSLCVISSVIAESGRLESLFVISPGIGERRRRESVCVISLVFRIAEGASQLLRFISLCLSQRRRRESLCVISPNLRERRRHESACATSRGVPKHRKRDPFGLFHLASPSAEGASLLYTSFPPLHLSAEGASARVRLCSFTWCRREPETRIPFVLFRLDSPKARVPLCYFSWSAGSLKARASCTLHRVLPARAPKVRLFSCYFAWSPQAPNAAVPLCYLALPR